MYILTQLLYLVVLECIGYWPIIPISNMSVIWLTFIVNWQQHAGHWNVQTGSNSACGLNRSVLHKKILFACQNMFFEVQMHKAYVTFQMLFWSCKVMVRLYANGPEGPPARRRSDGNRACGGEVIPSSSALLDRGQVLNHSIPQCELLSPECDCVASAGFFSHLISAQQL